MWADKMDPRHFYTTNQLCKSLQYVTYRRNEVHVVEEVAHVTEDGQLVAEPLHPGQLHQKLVFFRQQTHVFLLLLVLLVRLCLQRSHSITTTQLELES